jgi:hypothetical protein
MQVLEPVEEEPAAIRPVLKQKRLRIPRCLPYTMSKAVTRMLWWIKTDAFMFCFVTDHQLLGTVLMAFCELILFLVIVQDQKKMYDAEMLYPLIW